MAASSQTRFDLEFGNTTLAEYLNFDRRPSIVLDLKAGENEKEATNLLVFCNVALRKSSDLCQIVERSFSRKHSISSHEDEEAFARWVKFESASTAPVKAKVFFDVLWMVASTPSGWTIVSGIQHSQVDFSNLDTPYGFAKGSQPQDITMRDASSRNSLSSTDTDSKAGRASKRSRALLGDVWPGNKLPVSAHTIWVREFDWASTPLGAIDTWSPQLRQTCEMMLLNPDPAAVFWGPDLILIYNEAYIALAGNKHPAMMGGSARVHWKEVWDQYDPLFDQMRIDGKAFKQTKSQLFTYRKGYLEEGFYNMVVMPILGDDGTVTGFYEPVSEVTKQALSERRMDTLLQLSERTSSATSLKDLWRLLLQALSGHESDIYFALLYSLQRDRLSTNSSQYSLEGAVGLRDNDSSSFPPTFNLLEEDLEGLDPALRLALERGTSVLLNGADESLSPSMISCLKSAGIAEAPREVIIYPLSLGADNSVEAFLTIGLNLTRPYDDDYQLFIDLLARQVETTITFVKLFEKEKESLRQQALYESELKFQQFAEIAPVGIFDFDAVGNIRYCNKAWLDLSGHDRHDMSAMSWANDVHPDNLAEIKHYWDKLVNLEGPQTFEVQYKKPWTMNRDGEPISLDRSWVVASADARMSEDGRVEGVLGCVTDISSLKYVDKLQSQRLAEALELKRQQENFLDITSHEMRNPLNAILHCAAELIELLTDLRGSVSTEERGFIINDCLDASQTIIYCGKHQKRIIDDVLTLSKLDSNLLSISPAETRPLEVVEEVLRVFYTELRASNIETQTELAETYQNLRIDTVMIDSHRVIQILINLVANAIKFTKGEALRNLRMVISAYSAEPVSSDSGVCYVQSGRHRNDPTVQAEWGQGEMLFLHFSVQDTGPGMSREEADSLFNRFTQGSPRTHVQYGGSGLGLFISRELAELHGGRIGISSELGSGSTFDFYVKGRRCLPGHARRSSRDTTTKKTRPRRQVLSRQISDGPPPPMPLSSKSSPSVLQKTGPASNLHVLIVEDNLINQKILSKLMRKQGYAVSIANHGEEALSVILSSTWHLDVPASTPSKLPTLDIVLADIEMPVMDGKVFVKKVREWQWEGKLTSNIPVIAVTGNARSEQIEQAKECGFDDVVSKPYKIEDLVSKIKNYTDTET